MATPVAASAREDAIAVLCGVALLGGALADAWAHTNVLDTLEGFFTPWHALLYAGLVASAGWTVALAYRRRATAPRWWRDGWPAGYRLGAVGAAMFFLGGVGDMIWHQIFGVEVGLDGGFSPTHIVIGFGGVLLLTSPMRSWWAADMTPRRAVSGVLSLALGTTMLSALLLNFLALLTVAPTLPYRPENTAVEQQTAVSGVQSYLFATVLLVVPLLLCHHRRATAGVATAVTGVLSLFIVLMYEFPHPQTEAMLGAIAGAAVLDFVLLRLDAIRGAHARWRMPIAGALFGVCVWAGHLVGLHLAAGVRWSVELWAGTILFTSVLGAFLGGLAQLAPNDGMKRTG